MLSYSFLLNYKPKTFCREYATLKNNSMQLAMFMAVVLGFKPLMDDWIPVEKMSVFKSVCKSYGLKVREDVIFQQAPKKELPKKIIGRENLTTTSGYAFPLESPKEGGVHVFIAKDNKTLSRGMWYPLIIKGRVIFQPYADTLRYGVVLGYPDCCIDFFRNFNDWCRYSYLYEAFINTRSKPSYLCNPFLKDTPFSYIYHMPCSYSCEKTIKGAGTLRAEIKKREPEFVKLTDEYLKMAFLVFYERKFYCFKGTLKNNEIKYKDFLFTALDKKLDLYGENFKKGDALKLEGRSILIYKKGVLIKTIQVPYNVFAPEYPFLIDFNE